MKLNSRNEFTNFKALPVAKTKNQFKGFTTRIDIYELTKADKNFVEKLHLYADFKNRLKDMDEFNRKRWQKVFDYTLESLKNSNNKSIIAISDNKPCALLSFFQELKTVVLDAVCALPAKNGKKVNLGGTTLIYQLFKYAQDLKAKNIKLQAVTDGPFDVISKYKNLGFKDLGMEGDYVEMSCNKYKIEEKLTELSSIIDYKAVKNPENICIEDLII